MRPISAERHLFQLLILLILIGQPIHAHPFGHAELPPWQAATAWPDRVTASFGMDPATELWINWRTNASVGRTIAQIVKATPDSRFDLNATTVRADTQSVEMEDMPTEAGTRHSLENIGMGTVHFHSVKFSGLKPGTLYAWRVQGGRGNWTEWYQTRTASRSGPVSFVTFGDAQNGVRPNWSRVIRTAYKEVPDAAFFLHAGDLVQKGDSDYNWAEWFHAGGFIHAVTPVVPVPGNHENVSVWPDGPEGERVRARSNLWRAHFNLPVQKSLPETLHESVYVIPYSEDLHVFVVDSARFSFKEQAEWLNSALGTSKARWKVVSMHHPYFVPGEFDTRSEDALRRKAFGPVIARHEVDLVMTGHIHTYGRFSLPGDMNRQSSRVAVGEAVDVKTIFLISYSGAKATDLWGNRVPEDVQTLGDLSVDRVAGNTPMFQVIRIDGDSLSFSAHMATGEIYDAFTLKKHDSGRKSLVDGPAAYGDMRIFSNTGEYRDWYDMR